MLSFSNWQSKLPSKDGSSSGSLIGSKYGWFNAYKIIFNFTSVLVILFLGLISSNLSNKSIANGFEYLITLPIVDLVFVYKLFTYFFAFALVINAKSSSYGFPNVSNINLII